MFKCQMYLDVQKIRQPVEDTNQKMHDNNK